jgi:hypothetical protein
MSRNVLLILLFSLWSTWEGACKLIHWWCSPHRIPGLRQHARKCFYQVRYHMTHGPSFAWSAGPNRTNDGKTPTWKKGIFGKDGGICLRLFGELVSVMEECLVTVSDMEACLRTDFSYEERLVTDFNKYDCFGTACGLTSVRNVWWLLLKNVGELVSVKEECLGTVSDMEACLRTDFSYEDRLVTDFN